MLKMQSFAKPMWNRHNCDSLLKSKYSFFLLSVLFGKKVFFFITSLLYYVQTPTADSFDHWLFIKDINKVIF